MIRMIRTYEECRDFVSGFQGDPVFSAPMLSNEKKLQNNLIRPIEEPEKYCVPGIYRDGRLVGLFVFLVIREERYLEMLAGLSRDREVCREIFRYLEENYPGYAADFVFHPAHFLLREQLVSRGAEFETEQRKLVWVAPAPKADTTGVEPYSEKYAESYFDLHSRDTYWTGEKVAAAADRFRVFLALRDGQVVGYLDVTYCFEENEPYDLFVREEYRGMGYGKGLLAKALEENRPKGMMALVEADNRTALALYESMGFRRAENQDSLTVHWSIPEQSALPERGCDVSKVDRSF